ncbi:hypothetical protein C5B42_01340 [Candidatus Cerribacteria bacterium 'Amazon FNV 2010 28 9']|uniref:Uncharacterized protein n=1 Tax=Candidatus Cerribacteria bacterium 'Amazon FNV 2010 28 9' TaxID=2081795 RepID=A0A317JR01_9BACT|nr:MAG: hypothetical protein C5B42_01340 [Candidatus Cerribacteria bacterium 'Amazon FNV 2010 28 9']
MAVRSVSEPFLRGSLFQLAAMCVMIVSEDKIVVWLKASHFMGTRELNGQTPARELNSSNLLGFVLPARNQYPFALNTLHPRRRVKRVSGSTRLLFRLSPVGLSLFASGSGPLPGVDASIILTKVSKLVAGRPFVQIIFPLLPVRLSSGSRLNDRCRVSPRSRLFSLWRDPDSASPSHVTVLRVGEISASGMPDLLREISHPLAVGHLDESCRKSFLFGITHNDDELSYSMLFTYSVYLVMYIASFQCDLCTLLTFRQDVGVYTVVC